MSKLYSLYQNLKNTNNSTIYLFKSGIFYIAICEDATYLSNHFGFKLTKLNDTIYKCAFPVASIDKYSTLFTSYNIDFKLINFISENSINPIKNNDEIIKFIDKISNVNLESLSVLEVYKYIENIKQEATKIKNNHF